MDLVVIKGDGELSKLSKYFGLPLVCERNFAIREFNEKAKKASTPEEQKILINVIKKLEKGEKVL